MSQTIDDQTEKLLGLRIGQTCVIRSRTLNRKSLKKYAPEARWTAETREGGVVVTRVR